MSVRIAHSLPPILNLPCFSPKKKKKIPLGIYLTKCKHYQTQVIQTLQVSGPTVSWNRESTGFKPPHFPRSKTGEMRCQTDATALCSVSGHFQKLQNLSLHFRTAGAEKLRKSAPRQSCISHPPPTELTLQALRGPAAPREGPPGPVLCPPCGGDMGAPKALSWESWKTFCYLSWAVL